MSPVKKSFFLYNSESAGCAHDLLHQPKLASNEIKSSFTFFCIVAGILCSLLKM